ncbi:MAG: hypothetical protein AB8F34_08990 [Akkermansiaceae bacterium]
MSETNLPVSEYIKQGIFIVVIIAIALFGIKTCRKYQNKRDVIIELTSHASESSAYEQFYAKDARSNLLKAMHQIHLAVELGHTPTEILKEVMEESEKLMDTETREELPLSKQLIRDSLLSNYDNCKKLGVFTDPTNLILLEKGELPTIKEGPSSGEEAVIANIIPASLLEGVDKLIPNLVISPPPSEEEASVSSKLNEFEIARAKKFAKSLATADLIEKDAYKRIIDHFDAQDIPSVETGNP